MYLFVRQAKKINTQTHTQIDYPFFSRDFYQEHSDITALTQQEVKDIKKKMGIKVSPSIT